MRNGMAQRPTKSTGGYVDPSSIIDKGAALSRTALRRRAEMDSHAKGLVSDRDAVYALHDTVKDLRHRGKPIKAAAKELRDALTAFQAKHGYNPITPLANVDAKSVDVSTGADSWLERK